MASSCKASPATIVITPELVDSWLDGAQVPAPDGWRPAKDYPLQRCYAVSDMLKAAGKFGLSAVDRSGERPLDEVRAEVDARISARRALYEAGNEAFCAGHPRSACPGSLDEAGKEAWLEGYGCVQ